MSIFTAGRQHRESSDIFDHVMDSDGDYQNYHSFMEALHELSALGLIVETAKKEWKMTEKGSQLYVRMRRDAPEMYS